MVAFWRCAIVARISKKIRILIAYPYKENVSPYWVLGFRMINSGQFEIWRVKSWVPEWKIKKWFKMRSVWSEAWISGVKNCLRFRSLKLFAIPESKIFAIPKQNSEMMILCSGVKDLKNFQKRICKTFRNKIWENFRSEFENSEV